MRAPLRPLALLLLAFSCGCTTYEYEEEIFLGVDGSGRIRVSGSKPIFPLLHDIEEASLDGLRSHFERGDVELVSVRETSRRSRPFLHVQMRFSAWDRLCASPAFRERPCRLEVGDEELSLDFALPAPRADLPDDLDPEAVLAVRIHLPSRVRYHNARSGIERGNILSWERTAEELFGRGSLPIEARFSRRSVLAMTVRILGVAAALVLVSIGTALYLIVRKGRRQLAAEAAVAGRD